MCAGGTDLLVAMKEGRISPPRVLVSLNKIKGISGITQDQKGGSVIRAGTTIGEIQESPIIRQEMPLLSEAAGLLGSPQVRNRATLGGNICNASPAADMVSPLIALGASCKWIGPEGEGKGLLEHFFVGPGMTVLKAGEILWEVEIPSKGSSGLGVYAKLGRRKGMEIAIVNLAIFVEFAQDETCREAKIVLGSVSPKAVRARKAEAFLVGNPLTPERIEKAGKSAASECAPISDIRASSDYRKEMVDVLVKKTLREVLQRKNKTGERIGPHES
jgi:CO/xanthine dehydrogenase FAD-binding subunit